MTKKGLNITNIVRQNGYREITPIEKDEFGRFHGIVSNTKGNKFFVKAVVGKKSYTYKSLFAESRVSQYLSQLTKKTLFEYKGYRLLVPEVDKIINQGEVICLISRYIKGKKLLDEESNKKAEILTVVLELIEKLSGKTQRFSINLYLKDYSVKALLLYLPLRLLKSVFLSPFSSFKILMTTPKVLPLFRIGTYDKGLIHADINASNILLQRNIIYLTDWEEAGWGIAEYNSVGPLCVHWQNKIIRNGLLQRLYGKGLKKLIVPLLVYKTLTLLNQRVGRKNAKRIRDLELLNLNPDRDIKLLPKGFHKELLAIKGTEKT